MELGDSILRVQRASIGMKQAAGVEMGVNAMAMMAGTTSADLEASRVVQLLNMVTAEELMDPEEYDGRPIRNVLGAIATTDYLFITEICEDIREECEKFGKLVDLKVPRPSGGSRQTAGVGKVCISFSVRNGYQKSLIPVSLDLCKI
jgi:splicing factor U2AF subunit